MMKSEMNQRRWEAETQGWTWVVSKTVENAEGEKVSEKVREREK
jgi:hypothetical protein